MELPHLGGKPGEAVPEVDPEDLKALWREQQKIQAMHPGQHATGIDVMKAVCKPGSNVEAVWYRMSSSGYSLWPPPNRPPRG